MEIDETKIDWDQLKKQKQSLLNSISFLENEQLNRAAENLTGILHLIDYIQDTAVREGVIAE